MRSAKELIETGMPPYLARAMVDAFRTPYVGWTLTVREDDYGVDIEVELSARPPLTVARRVSSLEIAASVSLDAYMAQLSRWMAGELYVDTVNRCLIRQDEPNEALYAPVSVFRYPAPTGTP